MSSSVIVIFVLIIEYGDDLTVSNCV